MRTGVQLKGCRGCWCTDIGVQGGYRGGEGLVHSCKGTEGLVHSCRAARGLQGGGANAQLLEYRFFPIASPHISRIGFVCI